MKSMRYVESDLYFLEYETFKYVDALVVGSVLEVVIGSNFYEKSIKNTKSCLKLHDIY